MSTQAEPTPREMMTTLTLHDAAIRGLQGDMKTLSANVVSGFTELGTKFEKMNARPQLNVHSTVATILHLALLFVMVVSGIIYVAQSQFSGLIAKQESTNQTVHEKLDDLAGRVGWVPTTKRGE